MPPRDPDGFAARVNYAARIIAEGRKPQRAFDACFEQHDGDEVVTALVRRARRNPKLSANLYRYLNETSVQEAAERLQAVKSRQLARIARKKREAAQAAFDEWFLQIKDPSKDGQS
ncbi:hypothetical protein [Phyllobacterium sophorae]|uniref:Uncharacterized protein n=1 Tax=Phyllobacterium sophorae TaxID=1520277 RepID=A0A2P7B354_9HYPH|nr:hypothetical protein [Phyllobacterium sophorae]PSH60886.1 hypothetical protein CU103_25320 [Phyllobacterium sophorae]